MNTITHEQISDFFKSWNNSSSDVEGYVSYCWDVMSEELKEFNDDDYFFKTQNVVYVLQQKEEFESLNIEQSVVTEWLKNKKEQIIEEIKEQMES